MIIKYMRRGYKLVIAGTAILVVGIILIGMTFVILKQQSLSINSSFETISPGKSMLKLSEVKAGKKMAIVVLTIGGIFLIRDRTRRIGKGRDNRNNEYHE